MILGALKFSVDLTTVQEILFCRTLLLFGNTYSTLAGCSGVIGSEHHVSVQVACCPAHSIVHASTLFYAPVIMVDGSCPIITLSRFFVVSKEYCVVVTDVSL